MYKKVPKNTIKEYERRPIRRSASVARSIVVSTLCTIRSSMSSTGLPELLSVVGRRETVGRVTAEIRSGNVKKKRRLLMFFTRIPHIKF